MDSDLRRIEHRITLLATLSLALTPVVGYGTAILFGMVSLDQLFAHSYFAYVVVGLYGVLIGSAYLHFRHILQPMNGWLSNETSDSLVPSPLDDQLRNFSSSYWSFYLLYVLLFPTLQHWAGIIEPGNTALHSLLNFILLQLVVAALAGLPGYLQSLTLLGRLSHHLGLPEIQVSMKSKLLLVGGYVPLLTTTVLLKYYWWRTGYFSAETLAVWASLGLIAFVITAIAIRSLHQSLRPVQRIIEGRGGSSYADLAKDLRPQSNDEIGYLIQTLGKLFRRLSEQESHVSAIVDAAAEGIIVVDSEGCIQTFNPAAEHLFGYRSDEIHARPLSWLLPSVATDSGTPRLMDGEQEVEGRRSDGAPIPMSVRVSRMGMDGRVFYTCLVADISERKASEQMLLDAEARYRNLVETAHDLVWSMDSEGHWTYLNNAAQHIYGYSPDEMIGRHYSEFQSPESAKRDLAAMSTLLHGHDLLEYETIHLDINAQAHHISFNAKPLLDEDGVVLNIMGTARDITEQKAFEKELTYQAQHDTLTGLYNRNYFQAELEHQVARIARSGTECALLYLDLDQFKYVNDTLGHAAGDRLLLNCTELLRQHTRESDLLARFGGDEFTLLLYNLDAAHASNVAENLRRVFESYKFFEDGKTFNLTCSIGLSLIDAHTLSAEEAMSQADLACNIAKTQGRNRIHVYDPDDRNKDGMAEDMGWAVRVREAFEDNRFQLVYQPIISVADGKVRDYEVLLRMTMDNGELILPGGFMPAAERFGLIHNVDRWTVTHAIRYLSELHAEGQRTRFAINLSGRAFEDTGLLPLIATTLRDSGLDPAMLTFEITETAAIANLNAAMTFIGKLKDLGCRFALDDFGSGFCSFTYLKHLPVDILKIDGSFVQGMAHTRVDQAMVESMNQVAHALGKQTIAEFVENQTTLDILREYGVDYAQGYFLGTPRTSLNKAVLHSVAGVEDKAVTGKP